MRLRRVRSAALPTLLCLLSLLSGAIGDASTLPARVSRDASGRVLRRVVPSSDGARRVTTIEYWPGSTLARRILDVDLGREGRPTMRTLRTFDQRGRLLDRREVAIHQAGLERSTGTRNARPEQSR